MEMTRTERGKPEFIGGCDEWDNNAGNWVFRVVNQGKMGVDVMKLLDGREFFRLIEAIH